VRVAGKLAWADAIGFSGELSPSRFALDGSANFATIVVFAPDAAGLRDDARELAGGSGGATCVNGVLLLRFLDRDFTRLRAAVEKALAVLRPRVTGGPAAVPRLWLN
jgi:urease accessory protein